MHHFIILDDDTNHNNNTKKRLELIFIKYAFKASIESDSINAMGLYFSFFHNLQLSIFPLHLPLIHL